MNPFARSAAIASALALAIGLFSFAVQAAEIVRTPQQAGDGDLVVTANPAPARFYNLAPGDQRHWSVAADLRGADHGTLSLRVWGGGALVDHGSSPLLIAIDACDGTLTGDDARQYPACSGNLEPLVATQPLRDISVATDLVTGPAWELRPIRAGHTRSFVVTLAVPAAATNDESLMGLTGDFGVGLSSSGASPNAPGQQAPEEGHADLPAAGGPGVALLLIGVGAVGLGVALRSRSTSEAP